MEKFKHVEPSITYKEQALEYINELIENHSSINGVSGLDRYLNDYEGWLKKIKKEKCVPVSPNAVPSEVYFLIRERR